jgi:hypothetical protein
MRIGLSTCFSWEGSIADGNARHQVQLARCPSEAFVIKRIVFVLFLSLLFLTPHAAKAQQYASTANQCLREYYDSNNYNWLTFQNNCNQEIHVTLVSRRGEAVGALDLASGRHDGPGLTANEVRAAGGIEAYACPAELITSQVVNSFRCKRS